MTTATEIHAVGLLKRGEFYGFVFSDEYRRETLQTLGRFASDPGLSFSWLDAARVAKQVREETE